MSFQFHKGTIKTSKDITVEIYKTGNFNSIKVRLKRWPLHQPQVVAQFQFHKGTIKTLSEV